MRILWILLVMISLSQAHTVEMYEDYSEALGAAKVQQRPLLIYLYMLNCKTCVYMDDAVFADERVVDYLLDNYIVLHLYTNDRSLPQELRVDMSPVFHFIDPSDEGMIESIIGGRDPEHFLELLERGHRLYLKKRQ